MWQIPCKMTNSSSKPLQTLGKWYQPRNQKKNPKPAQKIIPKTISHPFCRMVQVWISMDHAKSADSEKPAPFGKEGKRTWPLGRCVSSSVVKVSGVLLVFWRCLFNNHQWQFAEDSSPLQRFAIHSCKSQVHGLFTPESPWQDRMALAGACGE